MIFKIDNETYSLLEIRKRLKTPAFRIDEGYRDERDFIQIPIGTRYYAHVKRGNKILSVTRVS